MMCFFECQRCLSLVLPSRLGDVHEDREVDEERCRAPPCWRLFHWCSTGRPQHIPGDLLSRFRETLPGISGNLNLRNHTTIRTLIALRSPVYRGYSVGECPKVVWFDLD